MVRRIVFFLQSQLFPRDCADPRQVFSVTCQPAVQTGGREYNKDVNVTKRWSLLVTYVVEWTVVTPTYVVG